MGAKDFRALLRRSTRTENPGDENDASAAPAVVLRAPAGYACALCQSQYARFEEARDCLETCSLHYRLRAPVHVLASPSGAQYRCCLCARVRVHRDDALRCFERCYRKAHGDSRLPARLADALERLRVSGADEPDEGLDRGKNPHGRSRMRGPLFHRRQGLLPGANVSLRVGEGRYAQGAPGAPLLKGIPSLGAEEALTPEGTPGSVLFEDKGGRTLGGSGDGTGRGIGSDPRGHRALSPEKKRSRADELLSLDLANANITEVTPPAGQASRGAGTRGRSSAGVGAGGGANGGGGRASSAPHAPAASMGEDYGDLEVPSDADEPMGNVGGGGGRRGVAAQGEEDDLSEVTPPPTMGVPAGEPMRDKKGNVLYRTPHQKPFKRADAKYVCTVCNSKFFSKGEVEACFLAHPLNEMV